MITHLLSKRICVDQFAVVSHGQGAVDRMDDKWLTVDPIGSTGRCVTSVTDADISLKGFEYIVVEHLTD